MDKKYLLNFVVFLVLAALGVVVYNYWFNVESGEKIEEEAMEVRKTIILPQEEPLSSWETEDGLAVEVFKEGEGEAAQNGDSVQVHYVGSLEDGTRFDSSLAKGDKGAPFTFVLGEGRVIQGWEKGVLGMKVGEKRKLTIPSQLGYGELGSPSGSIPPNAVLVFEIEMLQIN